MAKHSHKSATLEKSAEEAMTIARGTQKPGQTKEQTKLIAQGIQKGIELYKKQQAAKKRELDKKIKKAGVAASYEETSADVVADVAPSTGNKLPWILLALSWAGFAIYIALSLVS
jgi:hypothetical protein